MTDSKKVATTQAGAATKAGDTNMFCVVGMHGFILTPNV